MKKYANFIGKNEYINSNFILVDIFYINNENNSESKELGLSS